MRIGIFSLLTLIMLFFLVAINYTDVTDSDIDKTFQTVDANVSASLKDSTEDNNLSKFIYYTYKGVMNELHGTYYFTAWLNSFLPELLLENLDLIIILFVLSLASPIIWHSFLFLVFIFTVIKEWFDRKRGLE